MASASQSRVALRAALFLLCALLLLPSASAHCPSNKTCIKTGYFSKEGFKPSQTLLKGTPIVQAAQCVDLCTKHGFAYHSTLAGVCQCYETCEHNTFKHGQGFAGSSFYCYVPPSGARAATACAGPYSDGRNSCVGKVRKGSPANVTGNSYNCCCTNRFPNPVFSNGILKGCAGLGYDG